MNNLRLLFTITCVIVLSNNLSAQNTIYHLNGKRINAVKFQIDNDQDVLFYQFTKNNGKALTKSIDLIDVYSIEMSDGTENYFYTPQEDEYSVETMKLVLGGKNAALNDYKPYWAFGAGFILGAGSMLSPYPFYALSVPIALNVGLAFASPSKRYISKNYPNNYDDEYFIIGYKQSGRNKILKNSIFGSVAGIGVGIITGFIIESISKN